MYFYLFIDKACPITRRCYYMLCYTTIYTLQLMFCRFYRLSNSIECANFTNCVRCLSIRSCFFMGQGPFFDVSVCMCVYMYIYIYMQHNLTVKNLV
jgi:hypothetical protein